MVLNGVNVVFSVGYVNLHIGLFCPKAVDAHHENILHKSWGLLLVSYVASMKNCGSGAQSVRYLTPIICDPRHCCARSQWDIVRPVAGCI